MLLHVPDLCLLPELLARERPCRTRRAVGPPPVRRRADRVPAG